MVIALAWLKKKRRESEQNRVLPVCWLNILVMLSSNFTTLVGWESAWKRHISVTYSVTFTPSWVITVQCIPIHVYCHYHAICVCTCHLHVYHTILMYNYVYILIIINLFLISLAVWPLIHGHVHGHTKKTHTHTLTSSFRCSSASFLSLSSCRWSRSEVTVSTEEMSPPNCSLTDLFSSSTTASRDWRLWIWDLEGVREGSIYTCTCNTLCSEWDMVWVWGGRYLLQVHVLQYTVKNE